MTAGHETVRINQLPKDLEANPILSRWVTVNADDTIGVRVGKVEFGQGILTALAQIAADELGVGLDQVRMLPPNTRYGPDQGLTSGSMSIVHSGPSLRAACAQVRVRFVAEAARRWDVGVQEVTVRQGRISGGERTTSYGALAAAVDLDVPADPEAPLTQGDRPVFAGTSSPRVDLPDKIAGRPRYIHDLRLPGQLYGRVLRPPSPGAILRQVDTSRLDGMDVEVVRDGSFTGVIGADEAETMRAVAALRDATTWEEHDGLPDEDDLRTFLRSGPHETIKVLADEQPPSEGSSPEVRTLRAAYSRPFLAHASMAPSCGVARWNDDGTLSVWSHSQGIHNLRAAIAFALDLDAQNIEVEHAESAGCYGHNAADDAAFDAVLLARRVPGRPVHVQWSRSDELTWSPFGSAMSADVEAIVDDSGVVRSWRYDVWSQGHTSRPGYRGVPGLLAGAYLERPLNQPAAADPPLANGGGTIRNAVPIYDFPARRVTGHRLLETPIRSSAIRSLGAFMNVFAIESFMDELALAAGVDPLAYRLTHLGDARGRKVLETAAKAAGWGTPVPDDRGRGIGFARYKGKGAYCAVVAEVEAEQEVRVRRLTIAVDVGQVVNPDGVRNQIEGGAVQAASWTLKERVRFDRRRITSDTWESYPILRFSETPEISVELVEEPGTPPMGAGEAAQGPTAAAIANAIAAAIGVRARDLPLTSAAIVAAIEASAS
ncbi:xanthine dehydrogenase family protein molybdopterin-binding subunit [Actinomadura sp. HBU206391]|uniref:xanthine dehydrogenase family protein molybdopterin-binding subunit n=1 Tax=Actinomadura sp. HBU206391 TaxID=2731692 RepID=UPI0016506F6D|nr:molybdopterin cofactor-binding domain-containing protein [Actinomadura sp. HBU206391]MBC6458349.1 xanthine dehydrogenase family protein molybdopterin-binding subunit [Actinomadura sp. HBU206391]